MAFVLYCLGSHDGSGPVGRFLVSYDAMAHEGQGDTCFSPRLEDAQRFATLAEAEEYYRQVTPHRPTRPDGQPRRPLTAYSMAFLEIHDAPDA